MLRTTNKRLFVRGHLKSHLHMKKFWPHIYDSFLRVHGVSIGLVSLALSVLGFVLVGDKGVPVGFVVLGGVVAILIFVVLCDATRQALKTGYLKLPRVLRSLEPPEIYKGIERILLVEENMLFSHEGLVSLYVIEDEYEILIAVGKVIALQHNGLVQIGLTALVESRFGAIEKLKSNDSDFLKRLVIKPSVPSFVLDGV